MLFPLQVSVDNFSLDSTISATEFFIFIGVMAVIIGGLILVNATAKNKAPKGKGSASYSPGAFSGLFSGFTLKRLARNIGLNREQTKMLNFVFHTDQVADPEKSLATPMLLDRHFRRAYRILEQSDSSDNESQHKLAVLFSTRNMLENSAFGTISSTRQLKENTAITLTFGKDKFNVSTLSSKGDHLAVESPKTALGSNIKIQRGDRVTALIFTKSNKGFSFETRAVGYSNVYGDSALLLAHSNQLRFLSQRRYRRRQTNIASNMYLVYVEGSGKKQRLIVDKRRVSGSIADISVGGCSIKTTAPVQVGAMFKIEFTQEIHKVAALGQVLRTNRAGINTILHVKFLRVTTKSMNIINAYVYEYAHE
jgi:hypothetical protein